MEDQNIVEAMPYLNRYALMLTRNKADADDLVSMTIIKAIEIIRFQNLYIEKPKPYLARVMYNTFISQFCRSKYRTDKHIDTWHGSVDPRQDNVVYLSEILARVNKMQFNDKRVILSHIDGLNCHSIAKKYRGYRTSLPTVQKIVRDFKRSLAV